MIQTINVLFSNLYTNWIALSLVATVFLGSMSVVITSQTRKGIPVSFALVVIALTWIVTFGFSSLKNADKLAGLINFRCIFVLLFAGILSTAGNLALFESAKISPNPGLALAIFSAQSLVAIGLAYWFLGDKVSWLQFFGATICVLGVILIQLGTK